MSTCGQWFKGLATGTRGGRRVGTVETRFVAKRPKDTARPSARHDPDAYWDVAILIEIDGLQDLICFVTLTLDCPTLQEAVLSLVGLLTKRRQKFTEFQAIAGWVGLPKI